MLAKVYLMINYTFSKSIEKYKIYKNTFNMNFDLLRLTITIFKKVKHIDLLPISFYF